ncbi:Uncharacterized protein dnm_100640 [Desulfonema magnum]|uniref:Uncharacterized protein n=1 Tax=Desulfonema magnum TaxID=45655 RepID=A0A975C1F2_9BACT|nr:Uncharacterized protein dnm_100640 [Desulfonema magnum]
MTANLCLCDISGIIISCFNQVSIQLFFIKFEAREYDSKE